MKTVLSLALAATSLLFTSAAMAEETCSYGYTVKDYGPLNFAVCRGDLATLKTLVEVQHADLNARDGQGRNALDVAFGHSTVYWQSGFNPAVISYLVKHGADTNSSMYLATAAVFGDAEVAKILIDGGANVNGSSDDRTTPLEAAARCDFRLSSDSQAVTLVKLLLSHGADVHAKNNAALASVPTPCSFSPDLCVEAKLPTATWPSGSCKDTYLLLRAATNAPH